MKNRWDRFLRECEAADAHKAGKLAPEQFRSALARTDPKLTTEQKEWCAPRPGPPGRRLGPTLLPARAVAVSREHSRVKYSRLIEIPESKIEIGIDLRAGLSRTRPRTRWAGSSIGSTARPRWRGCRQWSAMSCRTRR